MGPRGGAAARGRQRRGEARGEGGGGVIVGRGLEVGIQAGYEKIG